MSYSEVQLKIFRDRYAFGDEEFPEEAWSRVARAVAENEQDHEYWVKQFYSLLAGFRFVPGGRIMAAMGTGAEVTAQNCYVIPSPEDSRDGIMHSLREWVEIQSKGGGVGINMSSLRPRGDLVKGVNGTSSGPVNWAQPFAFISKQVIIQGGTRRGAAMIMLDVSHPDIFEFIHAKETPGVLEGCNISVCISDAFMKAVKNDGDWNLEFNGKVYQTVKAKQIWDEICEAAWRSAEPGIYFMERANKQANSGYFEELIATNPCGEQPLGPYGACLLGAFNLMAFYVPGDVGVDGYFDFKAFGEAVAVAVRFQDNVIDLSHYPLPECEESQKRIRRMGLGIMGLADVLIHLGYRYGSKAAIEFTEAVYRRLAVEAYEASVELAKERGMFPAFTADYLDQPFLTRLPWDLRLKIATHGIRNCYLLTQAPTGTTSLLAGVNSGIEPYFDFEYLRSDRTGEYTVESRWAEIYESGDAPSYLVTSLDVLPEEHIMMQAAAQKWNDSSISKTVNAPNDHTVEDVKRLYMLAYDEGLKSISYYRDLSRQEQVLYHKAIEPAVEAAEAIVQHTPPKPRRERLPATRNSITHRYDIAGQSGYITVGLYEDGRPGELFLTMSKEGSTLAGLLNWGATIMSVALQWGVPIEELTDKMVGTQFEPAGFTDNEDIRTTTSVIDYLGRWLNGYFGDVENLVFPTPEYELSLSRGVPSGDLCPECGRSMMRQEGCAKCICGYSRC